MILDFAEHVQNVWFEKSIQIIEIHSMTLSDIVDVPVQY
jgi:hypothetical protein